MDKFPQPLKFQALGPNATDILGTELEFPQILPQQESASKRIVTEVTKIVYDFQNPSAVLTAAGTGIRVTLSYRALTAAENDQDTGTASLGSEAVLDGVSLSATVVTTGGSVLESPITHDLTDANGKGILFAGGRLFHNISSDLNTSSLTFGVAIYYRQRLVGLTEWLGIFASRQQLP
jgi:hypothetical protein